MNTSVDNKLPVRGVLYALSASILFGVTTPLAKVLLGETHPILLAGLFYLGSGIGLSLYLLSARGTRLAPRGPALSRHELPWLAGAIIAGGITAPVFLMFGLASSQASTASLFLNFESVFSALIAWFIFRENFDRRILLGMIAIVLGGIMLSVDFSSRLALSPGVLLIGAACVCWAIDNNLTRKISIANAAQIACLKGLVAGLTNTGVAVLLGERLPGIVVTAEAMVVGFLGYGVSLVLFVLALRHIGTARTGAYFSLAPFLGAIVAVAFLHEPIKLQIVSAGVLMAMGLWLHLTEQHSHEHEHEEMEHTHEHVHDEHHQHEHLPEDPKGEPHVHSHRHEGLKHTHPHYPDLHHNHH